MRITIIRSLNMDSRPSPLRTHSWTHIGTYNSLCVAIIGKELIVEVSVSEAGTGKLSALRAHQRRGAIPTPAKLTSVPQQSGRPRGRLYFMCMTRRRGLLVLVHS